MFSKLLAIFAFIVIITIVTGDFLTETVKNKGGSQTESHYATTDDGYILKIHRMLPKENISHNNSNVMLFFHGLFGSSGQFVIEKSSAGYYFSDLGYDVWMGNARGNMFSRNHTTLNPNEPEFWKFSIHELGVIDLPAMIDYILLQTNQTQLIYTGYSLGSAVILILLSERPEYNEKISLVNLMAPAALFKQTTTLMSRSAGYTDFLENSTTTRGIHELFSFKVFSKITQPIGIACKYPIINDICKSMYENAMGATSSSSWYKEIMIAIAKTFPDGGSFRQLIHFGQLVKSGTFRKYDHGRDENVKLYGSPEPSEYPIFKIQSSIFHILYGSTDTVVLKENIPLLIEKMKHANVVKISEFYFNHGDFVYSKQVRLVHKAILNVIKKYLK